MGLGPSIKMTTLHHYRCPATQILMQDPKVDFAGILVDGVSENYDDKVFTASRTVDLAEALHIDGALVAIDGWGNHHVDFVEVIDQLGRRGIPSVGLSYIGLQGRLVCDSPYVGPIIDFNHSESGYESCVVGQNNLTRLDAMKAKALLLRRVSRAGKIGEPVEPEETVSGKLVRKYYSAENILFGKETAFGGGVLTIQEGWAEKNQGSFDRIRSASLRVIHPQERGVFVNSNLDFMPIAVKEKGILGEGITRTLGGVVLMLTGVEEKSGFQPANIGSSEGILEEQVEWGQAGTPGISDLILHVDVLFREGEGRTAEGIRQAHLLADRLAEEIRRVLLKTEDEPEKTEILENRIRSGCPRIALIKIVSGLGNMYDTAVFPDEPGGMTGARMMRDMKNLPVCITSLQCLDGVIHSLL